MALPFVDESTVDLNAKLEHMDYTCGDVLEALYGESARFVKVLGESKVVKVGGLN
jgi:hypothetical protein